MPPMSPPRPRPTRTPLSTLIVLAACMPLIASCAIFGRPSAPRQANPPQLQTPAAARETCRLPTLPTDRAPTQADLERGYTARGVVIVECDGRRQLAVDVHAEEHRLEASWRALRVDRNRGWWARVTPWTEPE